MDNQGSVITEPRTHPQQFSDSKSHADQPSCYARYFANWQVNALCAIASATALYLIPAAGLVLSTIVVIKLINDWSVRVAEVEPIISRADKNVNAADRGPLKTTSEPCCVSIPQPSIIPASLLNHEAEAILTTQPDCKPGDTLTSEGEGALSSQIQKSSDLYSKSMLATELQPHEPKTGRQTPDTAIPKTTSQHSFNVETGTSSEESLVTLPDTEPTVRELVPASNTSFSSLNGQADSFKELSLAFDLRSFGENPEMVLTKLNRPSALVEKTITDESDDDTDSVYFGDRKGQKLTFADSDIYAVLGESSEDNWSSSKEYTETQANNETSSSSAAQSSKSGSCDEETHKEVLTSRLVNKDATDLQISSCQQKPAWKKLEQIANLENEPKISVQGFRQLITALKKKDICLNSDLKLMVLFAAHSFEHKKISADQMQEYMDILVDKYTTARAEEQYRASVRTLEKTGSEKKGYGDDEPLKTSKSVQVAELIVTATDRLNATDAEDDDSGVVHNYKRDLPLNLYGWELNFEDISKAVDTKLLERLPKQLKKSLSQETKGPAFANPNKRRNQLVEGIHRSLVDFADSLLRSASSRVSSPVKKDKSVLESAEIMKTKLAKRREQLVFVLQKKLDHEGSNRVMQISIDEMVDRKVARWVKEHEHQSDENDPLKVMSGSENLSDGAQSVKSDYPDQKALPPLDSHNLVEGVSEPTSDKKMGSSAGSSPSSENDNKVLPSDNFSFLHAEYPHILETKEEKQTERALACGPSDNKNPVSHSTALDPSSENDVREAYEQIICHRLGLSKQPRATRWKDIHPYEHKGQIKADYITKMLNLPHAFVAGAEFTELCRDVNAQILDAPQNIQDGVKRISGITDTNLRAEAFRDASWPVTVKYCLDFLRKAERQHLETVQASKGKKKTDKFSFDLMFELQEFNLELSEIHREGTEVNFANELSFEERVMKLRSLQKKAYSLQQKAERFYKLCDDHGMDQGTKENILGKEVWDSSHCIRTSKKVAGLHNGFIDALKITLTSNKEEAEKLFQKLSTDTPLMEVLGEEHLKHCFKHLRLISQESEATLQQSMKKTPISDYIEDDEKMLTVVSRPRDELMKQVTRDIEGNFVDVRLERQHGEVEEISYRDLPAPPQDNKEGSQENTHVMPEAPTRDDVAATLCNNLVNGLNDLFKENGVQETTRIDHLTDIALESFHQGGFFTHEQIMTLIADHGIGRLQGRFEHGTDLVRLHQSTEKPYVSVEDAIISYITLSEQNQKKACTHLKVDQESQSVIIKKSYECPIDLVSFTNNKHKLTSEPKTIRIELQYCLGLHSDDQNKVLLVTATETVGREQSTELQQPETITLLDRRKA